MFEPIPEESADDILTRVLAFRTRVQEFEKPDDINALVEIFPHVKVREGYVLDYVQETTKEGVVLPIQPFARPLDDESWIPMVDPDAGLEREDLVEQLYRYLEFELNPQGLFQYAFFVIELWSMRASRHAAEWLNSTPVFTAARFDGILEQARKVNDLKRPPSFGPMCRLDGQGGRVRFLVHTQSPGRGSTTWSRWCSGTDSSIRKQARSSPTWGRANFSRRAFQMEPVSR